MTTIWRTLPPSPSTLPLADFSRTGITDRSAGAIAAMKQLRVLRLMNTGITDATVLRLGTLDQLESLNLFGTPVTSAVLAGDLKAAEAGASSTWDKLQFRQGSALPDALAGKVVF